MDPDSDEYRLLNLQNSINEGNITILSNVPDKDEPFWKIETLYKNIPMKFFFNERSNAIKAINLRKT